MAEKIKTEAENEQNISQELRCVFCNSTIKGESIAGSYCSKACEEQDKNFSMWNP